MNDKLLDVLSRADDLKLRSALHNMVDAVKGCSEEDLKVLHEAGRLPDECVKFILSRRKG